MMANGSKVQKLVILGDIDQLPSIAPGNVLGDFFHGLKEKGLVVELKTNHR